MVWNVDRLEHIGVRLVRKGSKVTVTGRRSELKTREDRLIEQIELISLQILQLK